MAELNDIHINRDQDLLDRYLLNRLDVATRAAVERHLAVCPTCRASVREEARLAAGIRRFGREELRERLARRIRSSSGQRIPWQGIMAAAAVILVIVGIGIYDDWFVRQTVDLANKAKEPVFRESSPSPSLSSRVQGRPRESGSASAVETEQAAVESPRLEAKPEHAPGSADKLSSHPRESFVTKSASPAPPATTVWTEGNLIREQSAISADAAIDRRAMKKESFEKKDSEAAGKSGPDRMMVSQTINVQNVSVTQRPSSQLPPTQQALRQQRESNTVQTFIEERADSIRLVMYLDTLFDESALRNAVVQTAGTDSLVVRVANQRIGFRIPDGFQLKK